MAQKEIPSVSSRNSEMLYRLDEKMNEILRRMSSQDQAIAQLDMTSQKNYVSKDQFEPIQRIVYGIVGILGVATISAIIKLVVK